MLNSDLWETANGVLAILGTCIVVMVMVYLTKNIKKTYTEPIRFVTISFAMIVLGHTIKDGSAFSSRYWGAAVPDGVIVAAVVLIAVGKMGCLRIWSDPDWGHWPWILSLGLVGAFLTYAWLI